MESLKKQAGGTHYQEMKIQPLEYCAANMNEDEITGVVKKDVQKYIWRVKDGKKIDWGKAIHIIQWGLEALGLHDAPKQEGNLTATVAKQKALTAPTLFRFPKTYFVETNSQAKQIEHMASEAQEFLEAYALWSRSGKNSDFRHMMDEAADFVHSRESYERLGPEQARHIVDANNRIIKKNSKRNYYAGILGEK